MKNKHRSIYSRCDVKKNDVLLTKDGASTGNAALNILDEEFSLLSSVAFLRFDLSNHDPNYFLQSILSSEGQARLKGQMAGNAITRLTLAKIKGLKFAVPELHEQKAIAKALSDVDELIHFLEKLIAKKRDIKTATMQQLLTGKNACRGLEREKAINKPNSVKFQRIGRSWVSVKLVRFTRGASPRPIDSPIWFDSNSTVGWLRISDVTKTNKYLYLVSTEFG